MSSSLYHFYILYITTSGQIKNITIVGNGLFYAPPFGKNLAFSGLGHSDVIGVDGLLLSCRPLCFSKNAPGCETTGFFRSPKFIFPFENKYVHAHSFLCFHLLLF